MRELHDLAGRRLLEILYLPLPAGRVGTAERPHEQDFLEDRARGGVGAGREHVVGPLVKAEDVALTNRPRLRLTCLQVEEGHGVGIRADPLVGDDQPLAEQTPPCLHRVRKEPLQLGKQAGGHRELGDASWLVDPGGPE